QVGAAQPDKVGFDEQLPGTSRNRPSGFKPHVPGARDRQRHPRATPRSSLARPARADTARADTAPADTAPADTARAHTADLAVPGSACYGSERRPPPSKSETLLAERRTVLPSSFIRHAGKSPLMPVTLTAPAHDPSCPKNAAPTQKM